MAGNAIVLVPNGSASTASMGTWSNFKTLTPAAKVSSAGALIQRKPTTILNPAVSGAALINLLGPFLALLTLFFIGWWLSGMVDRSPTDEDDRLDPASDRFSGPRSARGMQGNRNRQKAGKAKPRRSARQTDLRSGARRGR